MSRKDRLTAKLKSLRAYLWNNMSAKRTHIILKTVMRVVRGWINYHNISDNKHRVALLPKSKNEHQTGIVNQMVS